MTIRSEVSNSTTAVLIVATSMLILALVAALWYFALHRIPPPAMQPHLTCAPHTWKVEKAPSNDQGILQLSAHRELTFVRDNGTIDLPIKLDKYKYDSGGEAKTTIVLVPQDEGHLSSPIVYTTRDGDSFTPDQIRCFKGLPSDGSKK